MVPIALLLALPALAAPPAAAPTPSPARLEALQRLAFLEGTWKGEGSMQMGPRRLTFESRETVTREVGGLALLIKGLHTAGGRTVHDALGVISAGDDGSYSFSTWLASGAAGVHPGEWKDGAFVWGLDSLMGRLRYTIKLDGQGRWHETGDLSRDGGQTWSPFFEMTLSKQK